jgi:anhydro-N-acetylmuramic acid kinase
MDAQSKPLRRAIGTMSGTSMDGVDVALLDTDGEGRVLFGPTGFRPYTDPERAILRAALAEGPGIVDRTHRSPVLAAAEALVTVAHAEAVERFMVAHGLAPEGIDAVGLHGQTVIHKPGERLTVQIGDGAGLARRLGVTVVHDFRAADVAAGGQGAPLVPVFHQALVRAADLPRPVAVLNVGGVSNITYVDGDDPPIACDVGPGNALIDDFMLERTGVPVDQDGRMAGLGRVHNQALAHWLDLPFFREKPPKSLDRNAFERSGVASLSTEDGAATLTAFTARAIAEVLHHLPKAPELWIVCGGGAFNPTFLRFLEQAVGRRVVTADTVGWNAAMMEAQAFAYLAVRALAGLPLTYPTTTGVREATTGGVVVTR